MKFSIKTGLWLWVILLSGATSALMSQGTHPSVLHATAYNSHFPQAAGLGESYNGMGVADDGAVYYAIDSPAYNLPGQIYSFNPRTKQITHIADLNTATGQGDMKAVAQGKVHVNFIEDQGKLYFSTHLGFYNVSSGVERNAVPPNGYLPYPGGHFVSYDLQTGKFQSLAMAQGEGIIAFNMDVKRGRLYGLTWPSGHFLRFDLKTGQLKILRSFFDGGETGNIGSTYRAICRRIVVDPDDGSAYFTSGDGAIHVYHYDSDTVETVPGVNLHKDYFGQYDPSQHGMAYNWRTALWNPNDHAIYGVNGASGYLFRFDPKARTIQVLERLTSKPSKASGMFDKVGYGYLGLAIDVRSNVIYYLTGSPLPPGSGEDEGSHLITYDIARKIYEDHGQIVLNNGEPASDEQALVLGHDGTIYTLAKFRRNGREVRDLISFHP